MGISATIVVDMPPTEAFNAFVQELESALAVRGMQFETGENGRLLEGGREVGRVLSWQPGKTIILEWPAPYWSKQSAATKVGARFEPGREGTRITLDHAEWSNLLGDRGAELVG